MSVGDNSLKKRVPAKGVKLVSSPAKVYASRASKPSAVAAISLADADATYGNEERDLINALKAKMNELLAALKK